MKRNKFSLSNYKLLSCNQGELVPIGLMEVLPGDSIQHATSALIRVAPLVSPVMHPVHAKIHHFFVPHRLIWDDWENFITGGPDGDDASVFPTITVNTGTGWAVGSLADYLGVPTGVDDIAVSALPFRAYAKVFNEFYRDQDLVTELVIDTTSGADTTTSTVLQNAAWEKDYFTSARPWEQKGAAISIPLSGDADVWGSASSLPSADESDKSPVIATWLDRTADGVHIGTLGNAQTGLPAAPANPMPYGSAALSQTGTGNVTAQSESVFLNEALSVAARATAEAPFIADLSGITAVDMNDLRLAMAMQRYEEARARYGSRYTEYLRYLGVKSSDARLQRPEYLGGGKQTIQFSEVLQTAPTTSGNDAGVADLKGHGIGAMRTNRYRRFFEEHGYVVSVLVVRPRTIYAQGIPRTWNRRTKEDFWQQELQHVGQQAILNKELYAAHATPEATFGYQDRYDEYRRIESSIAGEFRTTLDFWHMARIFGSDPTLNSAFVTSTPTDRIYSSTATDQLYVMANHNVQARRLPAKIGTSHIF